MDKRYKINWKTVLKYCIYRLKITSKFRDGKYAHVEYTYTYTPRYIPMVIFFLIVFTPYFLYGGGLFVVQLFNELFLKKKIVLSDTANVDFKMTKIFAYNRL